MQSTNLLFTKKEFIEHINNNIPDDFVIAVSNVVSGGQVLTKTNAIMLRQEFANEIFKEPFSVLPIIQGQLVHSIIAGKPENFVSKQWREGLEKSEGWFGITIKQ